MGRDGGKGWGGGGEEGAALRGRICEFNQVCPACLPRAALRANATVGNFPSGHHTFLTLWNSSLASRCAKSEEGAGP